MCSFSGFIHLGRRTPLSPSEQMAALWAQYKDFAEVCCSVAPSCSRARVNYVVGCAGLCFLHPALLALHSLYIVRVRVRAFSLALRRVEVRRAAGYGTHVLYELHAMCSVCGTRAASCVYKLSVRLLYSVA